MASSYYVIQLGAGSGNGSSLGNAASVATYIANTMVGSPTGGDTVFFSGTISSSVVVATSGTGNGGSRLTLDFSGATLTTVQKRVNLNGKNYLNINGGGTWSNGVFTSGGIIGALDTFDYTAFHFNSQNSHDVTIQGFQTTATSSTGYGCFVWGQYCYNLLVQNNNVQNVSSFYYTDDATNSHDMMFLGNYVITNQNVLYQSDIIQALDSYNVTIAFNKFVMRAPNNAALNRHNDIIQTNISGSGGAAHPYGWVIAYNWMEINQQGDSDGNGSILQMEGMTDNGATRALQVYGNVFVGIAGTVSNNGVLIDLSVNSTDHYDIVNNTFLCPGNSPTNTLKVNTQGAVLIKNNIMADLLGTGTGNYFVQTTATGTPNYNFAYGTTGGSGSAAFAGANGSTSTNPNFTNAGSQDYSLNSSSTLRNAGDNTVGSTYGHGIAFGATWPNPGLVDRTATWDPGAYQYVASSLPTRTISGKATMSGKFT